VRRESNRPSRPGLGDGRFDDGGVIPRMRVGRLPVPGKPTDACSAFLSQQDALRRADAHPPDVVFLIKTRTILHAATR
jgi:hypothetical protein